MAVTLIALAVAFIQSVCAGVFSAVIVVFGFTVIAPLILLESLPQTPKALQ